MQRYSNLNGTFQWNSLIIFTNGGLKSFLLNWILKQFRSDPLKRSVIHIFNLTLFSYKRIIGGKTNFQLCKTMIVCMLIIVLIKDTSVKKNRRCSRNILKCNSVQFRNGFYSIYVIWKLCLSVFTPGFGQFCVVAVK